MTNDHGVTWNYGFFTKSNPPVTNPFPIRGDRTRFNLPFGSPLGTNSHLGRGFTFLNPDYEPATQNRWRIEIERQIGSRMVFAIAHTGSYVGNLGISKNLRPLSEKYWAGGLVRNDTVAADINRNVTNPLSVYVTTRKLSTSVHNYDDVCGERGGLGCAKRRRRRCRCASSRRSDAADRATPPPPAGRTGVAGDLCVARRRRCSHIAFLLAP